MKKNIFNIILTLGAALALASCSTKELDDLTGMWTAPTKVEFTSVTVNSVVKDGSVRSFDISWSDGTNTLDAVLGGSAYYLTPTTYTASDELKAKTYLLGSTKVNGVAVASGSIIINKTGEANAYDEADTYSIDASLFDANGTPYALTWEGSIKFEQDAVAEPDYYYTESLAAVTDATWATIEGVMTHNILIDDGNGGTLANFALILADGTTDLSGSYAVKEYASEDHTAGNGWDFSAYGWGMGGSYYYDSGTLMLLGAGETIDVTKIDDGFYTFATSTGASFAAAVKGYAPGAVTLASVMSVTNYYDLYKAWGMEIHLLGLEISDGNVSSSYDAATYSTSYSGDGNFLKVEFYTEDGTVALGTYTPCAEAGTVTEGTFGIGYTGDYGAGSGTNWATVSGGAVEYENVTDGTLTIDYDGTNFTFTLVSSAVTATYTGPVEGLTVAGAEPEPEPEPEDPDTYALEGLTLIDTKTATSETVTQHSVLVKNAAGSEVGTFVIFTSADAADLTGTYVSTEYASEAGMLGNGWSWGDYFGGSYYYDATGSRVLIGVGESVTVSLADGVYTIAGSGFSFSGTEAYALSGLSLTKAWSQLWAQDDEENWYARTDVMNLTITASDANGTVASFVLFAAPTLATINGTWPSTENANEAGQLGNGWTWGDYNGGSYYMKDGERVNVQIGENVTISTDYYGNVTIAGPAFSFTGTFPASQTLWEGSLALSWSGENADVTAGDNPDAWASAGAVCGQQVRLYVTPDADAEYWLVKVYKAYDSSWALLEPEGVDESGQLGSWGSNYSSEGGYFFFTIDATILPKLLSKEYWGGILIVQGANCTLTKIDLL